MNEFFQALTHASLPINGPAYIAIHQCNIGNFFLVENIPNRFDISFNIVNHFSLIQSSFLAIACLDWLVAGWLTLKQHGGTWGRMQPRSLSRMYNASMPANTG
jgi:hypothetical protein